MDAVAARRVLIQGCGAASSDTYCSLEQVLDVIEAGDVDFHGLPLREISRLVLMVVWVEQVYNSFNVDFEAAHCHSERSLIRKLLPLLKRIEN